MQIENHILTVGAHSEALPQLAVAATVEVWAVPVDYRANGYFVAVTPAGQTPEIPACHSADAALLGSLPLDPDAGAQLTAAKAARLAQINTACEAAVAELAASYPAGEVQSWPQQVREAEAALANPAAATPLLTAISTARGLDVAELAVRVQAKTAAYAAASGALIGRRQAAEDRLGAATTAAEAESVTW